MSASRVAAVALAAAVVAWLALIFGWEPSVLTLPVDDAYYYLVIARRLALGEGFTFDGINVTNGFHPLWLFTLVPITAVSPSADSAMRVVLAVQVVCFGGGLWWLARGVGQGAHRVLAAGVCVLLVFHLTKVVVNGQESALAWLLGAVLVVKAGQGVKAVPEATLLGAIAGALVLTRLTLLALSIPLLVAAVHHSEARGPLLRRATAVMVLLVGGWLVTSVALTGYALPVSAAIKAAQARVGAGWQVVGAVVLLASVGWWWRRRGSVLAGLALAALAHTAVDVAWRGVWVPEIWTVVPHLLLGVVAVAQAPRWVAWATGAVALLLAAGSWRFRLDPESWSTYAAARRAGEWLAMHSEPGTVSTGWDCGMVAAFSGRPVVNLDGLVNSWAFKEQVLEARALDAYLRDLKPTYLVQYVPVPLLRRDAQVRFKGATLGDWRVVAHECFWFRPALRPHRPQGRVFLILSRQEAHSALPRLSDVRGALCPDAGATAR